MKTVVLRLDRYSKIILTVIAVALTLIALKPLLPQKAISAPQVEVWVANPDEIGWWVDYYSD